MQKIKVSKSFLSDFQAYCLLYDFDSQEVFELRNAVRLDFSQVGRHIVKTMSVHNWMISVWGYVPTSDLLQGYLYSIGWYPKDDSIFHRLGIRLLAELCYDVANCQK